MQQQRRPLPAILCLIDGYQGSLFEGREGSGVTEGMKRKLELLDRYPGRWAIVSEDGRRDGERFLAGTSGRDFAKYGCEVVTVNRKTYARRPHPSGLPIDAYVSKHRVTREPLPIVEQNRFGWSATELSNALATAKAWLFPTEGIQAA
jgi:hypothetical protein